MPNDLPPGYEIADQDLPPGYELSDNSPAYLGEPSNDLGVGTTRKPASKVQQLLAMLKSKIPTSADDLISRGMNTPITPTGALAKMLSPGTEQWMREHYLSPNLGGIVGPRGATSAITKPVQIAANTIGLIPGMDKYTSAPVNEAIGSMQESWQNKVGSDPMGEMIGQAAPLLATGGQSIAGNIPASGSRAVNFARPIVEASGKAGVATALQTPTGRVSSPQQFMGELANETATGTMFGGAMALIPQLASGAREMASSATKKLLGVKPQDVSTAISNQAETNALSRLLGVESPELTLGQATGKKSWLESVGENMPFGIKKELQNQKALGMSEALASKYEKGFQEQPFMGNRTGAGRTTIDEMTPLQRENLDIAGGNKDAAAKASYGLGVKNKMASARPGYSAIEAKADATGGFKGGQLDDLLETIDRHLEILDKMPRTDGSPVDKLYRQLSSDRRRLAVSAERSMPKPVESVVEPFAAGEGNTDFGYNPFHGTNIEAYNTAYTPEQKFGGFHIPGEEDVYTALEGYDPRRIVRQPNPVEPAPKQPQRTPYASPEDMEAVGKHDLEPSYKNVNKIMSDVRSDVTNMRKSPDPTISRLGREEAGDLSKSLSASIQDFADQHGFGDELKKQNARYAREVIPYEKSRLGRTLNNPDASAENFIGLHTGPKVPLESKFVSKVLEPKGRAAVRADKVQTWVDAGKVGDTFHPGKAADAIEKDIKSLPVWFRRSQRKELEGYASVMKMLKDTAGESPEVAQKMGKARQLLFGAKALGGAAVLGSAGAVAGGPVTAAMGAGAVFGSGPFSKWLLTSKDGKAFLLEAARTSGASGKLSTAFKNRIPEMMGKFQASRGNDKLKTLLGQPEEEQE